MGRRYPASGVGLRLRHRTEIEFVLVADGDQAVLPMGFASVELGLAVLVVGPVGVAEVGGAVQRTT